jgi:uncharacterized metal-binding protein
MVDLPKMKVGIVACSGEEIVEGTITRLAALSVLEQLRRNETVTICLPLFLAGGEGDRAFARFFPTIAVDGCELRCAARATEKFSNKPAISLTVTDLLEEYQIGKPQGSRSLNAAGKQAVELLAQRIAHSVDELLVQKWSRGEGKLIDPAMIDEIKEISPEPVTASCACGSGIPVQNVIIAGKQVSLAGLPLIFQQFCDAGKFPDDANLKELVEVIKIYNPIPVDEEQAYKEGIRVAYAKYWFKEKNQ